MSWTTPRTWNAGETVTATIMNTHIRDNLNALFSVRVQKVFHVISTVGNVGTGEDVLALYNTAAGELLGNGQMWRGAFMGSTANNANAKTLRLAVYDGTTATTILTATLTPSEAGRWILGFQLQRVSSTEIRGGAQVSVGPSNSLISRCYGNQTGGSFVFANAGLIQVSAEATSNNDVTLESGAIMLVL